MLIAFGVLGSVPGFVKAETSHGCAGFIDSLPATVTTQGVWCLRKDLSTGIRSGNAITINANNVTIDCNDYKVGGLSAGAQTEAVGIASYARDNITVRNCNVRGFHFGIYLAYDPARSPLTSGAQVLNNRIEGSTQMGVAVESDGATIRGNTILDTGNSPAQGAGVAIWTQLGVDIIDNLIDGVYPTGNSTVKTYGMLVWNNQGGVIAGNRIRNVVADNGNHASGIAVAFDSIGVAVKGNVVNMPDGYAMAIECFGVGHVAAMNMLTGPVAGMSENCRDGGGNVFAQGL